MILKEEVSKKVILEVKGEGQEGKFGLWYMVWYEVEGKKKKVVIDEAGT